MYFPRVDATLYRQLVGSLLYLTHSRPDISFVVGLVAWYMQHPHESHWKATKRMLRYICGTTQFGIHYSKGVTPLLVGLTYSDWICDPDGWKSTASYVSLLVQDLLLGIARKKVPLLSLPRKQSIV